VLSLPRLVQELIVSRLLIAFILMLILGTVGFVTLVVWPMPAAATVAEMEGDPKRGAYLIRLSGCITCHTAPGNRPFEGGAAIASPFGSFFAPNITPDRMQGIGSWSFNDFARSIRSGVSPSGQPYYPAFPYEFYSTLTDRDLADMWSALQALPPSAKPSEPHRVWFPFNIRAGLKLWKPMFERVVPYTPRSDKSAAWNRGLYIATGPAHCGACHTPRNLAGGLLVGQWHRGNPNMMDGSSAPAITPGALAARGYTKESLVTALRSGVLPDGDAVGGSMVEVVQGSTKFLLTDHLNDIATYLLDLE
jgi:mono/diheme cytochrome c family protein